MKILVLAGAYPHSGHPFSGAFNEKCVAALTGLCDGVEVLAPRPYAPPLLSFVPRWKAYAAAAGYEIRDGVPVYRPAIPVIPRMGAALWVDLVAYFWCRRVAGRMNHRAGFDAILSFDLVETGGMAWRMGRDLGIPASGWAFGEDVRLPRHSPLGQVVTRAIERLDVVFYQSQELLEKGAELLGTSVDRMSRDRHIVLPHGIPEPPLLPRTETRTRVRSAWGISDDQVVVLNVGRTVREKGVFELLEAISLATARDPRVTCVMVGSNPAFDETTAVQKRLDQTPSIRKRVRLLPACGPDKVWEYLCASDIFAFPSHKEGISNSLLEAMAMEVPAIAFSIPSVLEIEAGTEALVAVPPLDSVLFSEAILRLAASREDRVRIGQMGRAQVMDRFMVRKNMADALLRLGRVVENWGAPRCIDHRQDW